MYVHALYHTRYISSALSLCCHSNFNIFWSSPLSSWLGFCPQDFPMLSHWDWGIVFALFVFSPQYTAGMVFSRSTLTCLGEETNISNDGGNLTLTGNSTSKLLGKGVNLLVYTGMAQYIPCK